MSHYYIYGRQVSTMPKNILRLLIMFTIVVAVVILRGQIIDLIVLIFNFVFSGIWSLSGILSKLIWG